MPSCPFSFGRCHTTLPISKIVTSASVPLIAGARRFFCGNQNISAPATLRESLLIRLPRAPLSAFKIYPMFLPSSSLRTTYRNSSSSDPKSPHDRILSLSSSRLLPSLFNEMVASIFNSLRPPKFLPSFLLTMPSFPSYCTREKPSDFSLLIISLFVFFDSYSTLLWLFPAPTAGGRACSNVLQEASFFCFWEPLRPATEDCSGPECGLTLQAGRHDPLFPVLSF